MLLVYIIITYPELRTDILMFSNFITGRCFARDHENTRNGEDLVKFRVSGSTYIKPYTKQRPLTQISYIILKVSVANVGFKLFDSTKTVEFVCANFYCNVIVGNYYRPLGYLKNSQLSFPKCKTWHVTQVFPYMQTELFALQHKLCAKIIIGFLGLRFHLMWRINRLRMPRITTEYIIWMITCYDNANCATPSLE